MTRYEITLKYSKVGEIETRLVCTPAESVAYMAGAFDERPMQEQFWLIFLNRKNRAIGRHLVTVGTLSSTLIAPREVFKAALLADAAGIILCHNHPSGDPAPSRADAQITGELRAAGDVLGIEVLDHVIIGNAKDDPTGAGFYSFRNAGLIG